MFIDVGGLLIKSRLQYMQNGPVVVCCIYFTTFVSVTQKKTI